MGNIHVKLFKFDLVVQEEMFKEKVKGWTMDDAR